MATRNYCEVVAGIAIACTSTLWLSRDTRLAIVGKRLLC